MLPIARYHFAVIMFLHAVLFVAKPDIKILQPEFS